MQDTRALPSTGFRPPFGLRRVTFLCVAKEKSPKERPPPLVRPPTSGSLGSPLCPTALADGPSLAQRRSLGVLPRGLDKRAHLGEQEGAKPNPQYRGQLTAPVYSEQRSGGLLSLIQPLATVWQDQIVALIQQARSTLLHRCKNVYEYSSKRRTALLGIALY